MEFYKARVKFANEEWLVIDAMKYNGKSYMYLAKDIKGEINSKEEFEKRKDELEFIFIEKVNNDNYIEVIDRETKNELDELVIKRKLSI